MAEEKEEVLETQSADGAEIRDTDIDRGRLGESSLPNAEGVLKFPR